MKKKIIIRQLLSNYPIKDQLVLKNSCDLYSRSTKIQKDFLQNKMAPIALYPKDIEQY